MTGQVESHIAAYLDSLPSLKKGEMQTLHSFLQEVLPGKKLWFLDGKNEHGKVVTNPNIGYGECTMHLAGGKTRDFYRIGLSATASGISIYIMGMKDKNYLSHTIGKSIGKAKVTGYCIQFKSIQDIQLNELRHIIVEVCNSTDS